MTVQISPGVYPGLPPFAELRRAAAALWPERRFEQFRVHGGGWANLVLEANGEVMFRIPRRVQVARSVGFEVRVLGFLGDHLTVPVPEPQRLGVLEHPRGWPFFSYPKLPGVPLSEVPSLGAAGRTRLRRFLGRLLSELAGLPTAPLARLGCPPGDRGAWQKRYVGLLERYERSVSARISPQLDRKVRADFDGFLRIVRESMFRPVLTHLDLGPYNILWDPQEQRPSGVLDWEDVRFGDPAFDLTGLKILGAEYLRSLARSRKAPGDATFAGRLDFYRRVVPVHELLHAVEFGKRTLFRAQLRELRVAYAGASLP